MADLKINKELIGKTINGSRVRGYLVEDSFVAIYFCDGQPPLTVVGDSVEVDNKQ